MKIFSVDLGMADFEKAIPIILKHEGGFVNHPSDPGGATNRGITFSLFKQYCKVLGLLPTVDALKSLTEDQAKFIYREHFWNPIKGDEFKSQALANIVFDGYVNMGNRALKLFQKILGVEADGLIGPRTLAIMDQQSSTIVFMNYKDARRQYYINLVERKPEMNVFLKGWLNRINSFEYA